MIQAFRMGAVGQNSVTNVKWLTATGLTNNANYYMTMERPVETDYRVTAGYTLYITKLFYQSSTNGDVIRIGYGDTPVAYGSSAPTNFVQLSDGFACESSAKTSEFDVMLAIPAEKYPCVKIGGAGATQQFQCVGVEIAN